ncbi:alkyl sulfatase dimerization domain-containing protein [Defluviimonas sp. SAOS-178_SWC]|uniref:alkyl sulfatase dimerization domain-containing protein n=1 Tax=Defluviimonas sp. SAOS-178_SWC TaxID=3121287 RepID=UPI00322193BD
MNEMTSPVETGPKGEIAHRDLLRHGEQFAPKLRHITDNVWHLVGVRSIANCTMIEGETGIILVDSGSSIDDAEAFVEEFRTITDKPIVAVLYTHSHYCRGASAYLPKDNPQAVQVWGHEKVDHNYKYGRPEIFPTYVRKISTQMGNHCPDEGPDAPPNAGLGGEYHTSAGRYGYVSPTHTVSEPMDVTIDGVAFRLIPSISDTDDCLTIWLPKQRVVIENIFWRLYPNFGAIRGEFYRKPVLWAQSIEEIRQLHPEHILGCHGIPYSGEAAIQDMLSDYRDAILYLYDQTVRGINLGLDADAMVERIRLPDSLRASPALQEHYGEFQFGIRGVYNGIMGWYGTDTAQLKPVPRAVEAERLVTAMGGVETVLADARKWLAEGEAAWAAQLVTYLLRLDPDHAGYKQLKADALRHMGQRQRSSITRNYYLTHARELEGKADTFKVPHRTVGKVLESDPGTYVELLRYEVDPAKATGKKGEMELHFGDLDRSFVIDLANSVIRVTAGGGVANAPRLSMAFGDWAEVIAGDVALRDLVAGGRARITGDRQVVVDILSVFDNQRLELQS